MIAVSVSRFYGVHQALPATELILFLYPIGFGVVMGMFQAPAVDEVLFSFDKNYGYFELNIARFFYRSPVLDWLIRLVYFSLMLAITFLYMAMPSTAAKRQFAGAVALAGTTVIPMYALCPAAGPTYLLRNSFPWRIPPLFHPHARIIYDAALNATPSAHVAWAVLMFWFARKYCTKAVRIAAGVFMVGTCLATLGTGEHYIIDLVLSVPLAAFAWALVHRQWRFAAISLAVVLPWLISLREGWALSIPPVLVWILTGATIAPFLLYQNLRPAGGNVVCGIQAAGYESKRNLT